MNRTKVTISLATLACVQVWMIIWVAVLHIRSLEIEERMSIVEQRIQVPVQFQNLSCHYDEPAQ